MLLAIFMARLLRAGHSTGSATMQLPMSDVESYLSYHRKAAKRGLNKRSMHLREILTGRIRPRTLLSIHKATFTVPLRLEGFASRGAPNLTAMGRFLNLHQAGHNSGRRQLFIRSRILWK